MTWPVEATRRVAQNGRDVAPPLQQEAETAALDELATGVHVVTTEEVLQVAREIFAADRLALTVLGPLDGIRMTRANLEC